MKIIMHTLLDSGLFYLWIFTNHVDRLYAIFDFLLPIWMKYIKLKMLQVLMANLVWLMDYFCQYWNVIVPSPSLIHPAYFLNFGFFQADFFIYSIVIKLPKFHQALSYSILHIHWSKRFCQPACLLHPAWLKRLKL